MFRRVLAGLALALAGHASAESMRFELSCTGNAVESCFIFAIGEITRDTPDDFAALLAQEVTEGRRIALHSLGGNLGAGIKLGRMIREQDLIAVIGEPRLRPEGSVQKYEYPTAGTCASACAYAFLGGTTRLMMEGSKLGFHQFYMGVEGASSSAQQVSGQLVGYLVEMGVDPRIFTRASSESADSMYWVSDEEAEEFDLITPSGYGAFFMEPYGNGVIAAARRKTPPVAYDNVFQVTAFCRDAVPKLLFTSTYAPERSAPFAMSLDGREILAEEARVTTRRGGDELAYLEVTLTLREAAALSAASQIETSFHYSRAEGGFYPTRLDLSDMDREMLAAAFRLCL